MKLILVDERISQKCESSLINEGFNILRLPPDKNLGEAVKSHADTLMFYDGQEIITTKEYGDLAPLLFSEIKKSCPERKIRFTLDKRSPTYPDDCIMNGLKIGNLIFCKSDSISSTIVLLAKERGYEICHTAQGYPACTTLAFGNRAITADPGMANALSRKGIEVLLVKNGHISLPPYEYGFIGGASFVFGEKIYFFGDITKHPDCKAICDFIKEGGFTPISLSDENLTDLGGAILF